MGKEESPYKADGWDRRVPVIPGAFRDELLARGATALTAGRDPVLAKAAEELGVKLAPEDAGKAFPYEWPPE